MRIALDAQLAVGTATGIGEYVSGLAHALWERGVDVVPLQRPGYDPWRFDRRLIWDQVLLPLAARRAGAQLLHCASGTMPLWAPTPNVVTVHDVAWLRVQQHARLYARAYFGGFQLARYARAGRVVVDSHFSRDEFLEVSQLAPERVDVVYPGVAEDLCRLTRMRDRQAFALVVGTIERRKNLTLLVRALPALENLCLVAVGPSTPYRNEVEQLARELGVAGRVELRGYVPREELRRLYAGATVVAMPSRYEGFGYGAAQALCAGVPLLAAKTSSLPEVVGNAAPLLDPDDVGVWIDALRLILADPEAADARAAAVRPAAVVRFAWATAAAAMEAIYARAIAQ